MEILLKADPGWRRGHQGRAYHSGFMVGEINRGVGRYALAKATVSETLNKTKTNRGTTRSMEDDDVGWMEQRRTWKWRLR